MLVVISLTIIIIVNHMFIIVIIITIPKETCKNFIQSSFMHYIFTIDTIIRGRWHDTMYDMLNL